MLILNQPLILIILLTKVGSFKTFWSLLVVEPSHSLKMNIVLKCIEDGFCDPPNFHFKAFLYGELISRLLIDATGYAVLVPVVVIVALILCHTASLILLVRLLRTVAISRFCELALNQQGSIYQNVHSLRWWRVTVTSVLLILRRIYQFYVAIVHYRLIMITVCHVVLFISSCSFL